MEKEMTQDAGAVTDTTPSESTTPDSGAPATMPVQQELGDHGPEIMTASEDLRLNSVVIECSPDHTSHPALEAFGMVILGLRDTACEVRPMERVSLTTWKYYGVINLYLDMSDITIVLHSEDYGDMGYLTLKREEIVKDIRSTTSIMAKHKFTMEEGIPLMLMSFEVEHNQKAPNSSLPSLVDQLSRLDNLAKLFQSQFQQTGNLADISNVIRHQQAAVHLIPEGHANLYIWLDKLGGSFLACFKKTFNLADISSAIEHQQQAVHLAPEGYANMPLYLGNLGTSFLFRFRQTSSISDISNAIKYHQQAVQLTLEGHAHMPSHLGNLGNSFFYRFQQTNSLDDIHNAVKYQQQAVQLIPEGHAFMPLCLANLGRSFSSCFQQTHSLSDIDNAIKYQQQAVQLTSEHNPNASVWLGSLGDSFLSCFRQTGNLTDISDAIKHQQRAIQLTPEGHANMPSHLGNLGSSFLSCFERTGDLADISNAIKYHQQAVQLTPEAHADLPLWLENCGNSFLARFSQTGDIADISNATKYHQQAVQLTPEGHANMPFRLSNLGRSFASHFERTGDIADISNAIKYQKKAVYLTPEGHGNMPSCLANLGSSFFCRFQRTNDLDDISNAIKHQQQAVQLTPEGNVSMPFRLASLGKSFASCFQHTRDLADISNAIKHQQKAIHLTPEGHIDLPIWLGFLGDSFSVRWQQTGDPADISNAIKHQQHAIQLTSEGHTSMPGLLSNLGNSFLNCFQQTNDLTDVSNAIKYQQKAAHLTPEGHSNMPIYLGNLGNSFFSRFQQTGDIPDISNSIKYKKQAIQLTPESHANMPSWLANLGNSYLSRFAQSDHKDDISNAIKCHQQAVKLTPEGHANMFLWLANLGTSFFSRFQHTHDPADISNAIKYQQQALQLTPEGHSDMSLQLSDLGYSFLARFQHKHEVADIVSAIEYQQKAVQLTPQGHASMSIRLDRLGRSFLSRFRQTGDTEDCYTAALNFRLAAIQISKGFVVRLTAARQWALCTLKLGDSDATLEAFTVTIELLSLVAGIGQTIQKRHKILAKTSDLTVEAANFAFSVGKSDTALEWLEQGRCLVWSQINQLRTPLDTLPPSHKHLADHFLAVSKALEASGSRQEMSGWSTEPTLTQQIMVEDQVHAHVTLAQEWAELLGKIRDLPSFNNFLRPLQAADILSQLPPEGLVIVINVHPDRSDALVLKHGADKPIHIPLKKFTHKKAGELQGSLHKHLRANGLRMREVRASMRCAPENRNALPHILKELWISIVKPILENLGYTSPPLHKTRIWWCATGPLAFLPIHAAGIYDQKASSPGLCTSDFAVSSYIPTVNMLLETLKKPSNNEPTKTKLLLLSQPNTPNLPAIPGTTKEAQAVYKSMKMNSVDTVLLEDKEATVDQVMKEMKDHGWIHFACHASQNITDPLTSGFYFHDGQLELSEIIRQQLPASEFAFLSACQTSVGDEKLSEEAVHLAAGMLAAGYRGTVATMWSIKDASAPDIAGDFYEYLLKKRRENGKQELNSAEAAYALDHAIQQVRCRLGNREEALLTWVPYVHFGL